MMFSSVGHLSRISCDTKMEVSATGLSRSAYTRSSGGGRQFERTEDLEWCTKPKRLSVQGHDPLVRFRAFLSHRSGCMLGGDDVDMQMDAAVVKAVDDTC